MRNLTPKKKKKTKTNLINYSVSCMMDQQLELKGKSGDSMARNLGEEDQTQKVKEVQKEQKIAVEGTDHRKNVPKVTNTSK